MGGLIDIIGLIILRFSNQIFHFCLEQKTRVSRITWESMLDDKNKQELIVILSSFYWFIECILLKLAESQEYVDAK